MTVTNVEKDPDALTMTITCRFAAPVERVWELWADPRRLERWWGPPTWPATVVEHELTPGGKVTYFMTGPDGEQSHGWWRVLAVDAPRGLDFEDGFADDGGQPNLDMPVTVARVRLTPDGEATEMTIATTFPSREAMEQMVSMGMEEGITLALGQADALVGG